MTADGVGETTATEMQQNFAENLRYLCGFYPSVAHVCRSLDVNRTQFNRYLGATSRPSPHILSRICDHFGVEAVEIHLTPARFRQIIELRRKARPSAAPHVPVIEDLQKRSRERLAPYLGLYQTYYGSMSSPGAIIRGVARLFATGDAVYYRWIEHGPRSSDDATLSKWRYSGSVFYLSDRIFMVGLETLTTNEIAEAVLYPSFKNKVGRLTGLLLGVSSSNRRDICCSRVLLERLPEGTRLRDAIAACGIFPAEAPEIGPAIRKAVDNLPRPSEPLFYATTL